VAIRLCEDIRKENRASRSAGGVAVPGLRDVRERHAEKMCLSGQPGYRGCALVNKRYVRRYEGA
jgi:hypothetical protein